MITNSANFIFLPRPAGDNSCLVPADDYNSAVDICRAIGATSITINGKGVASAVRRGDQMLLIFHADNPLTPEELCKP